MGAFLAVKPGNLLRRQVQSPELRVQPDTRSRTRLPVDEHHPRLVKTLQPCQVLRVARRDNQTQPPLRQVDQRYPPARQQPPHKGDIVSVRFFVPQVAARQVRLALRQCHQAAQAAGKAQLQSEGRFHAAAFRRQPRQCQVVAACKPQRGFRDDGRLIRQRAPAVQCQPQRGFHLGGGIAGGQHFQ